MTKFTRNSFFWIPDLQDLESPEMFTEKQILQRRNLRKNAIARKYVIYFSSEHAMKIFSDLQQSPKSYGLLRFSTSPEKLKDYGQSPLVCRDCQERGYFYLPNQWWKHKNHIRTVDAFIQYRANGGKLHLVLSGKREDYRWPDYYKSVETLVNLCNQDVHDLGFLERKAQLSVLFAAKIVLQTSLYEGWSTTVEESLVSGKILVVSNLPVFIEQGKGERNIIFVDPLSIDSIVQGMRMAESFKPRPHDSHWRWNRFEMDFKELLRSDIVGRI
jgi:glycosyltransferase involved in cell wall biosynthesis